MMKAKWLIRSVDPRRKPRFISTGSALLFAAFLRFLVADKLYLKRGDSSEVFLGLAQAFDVFSQLDAVGKVAFAVLHGDGDVLVGIVGALFSLREADAAADVALGSFGPTSKRPPFSAAFRKPGSSWRLDFLKSPDMPVGPA
jgi:hypothetical protein